MYEHLLGDSVCLSSLDYVMIVCCIIIIYYVASYNNTDYSKCGVINERRSRISSVFSDSSDASVFSDASIFSESSDPSIFVIASVYCDQQ